nr:transporter substrate-binding domain-containing protein [uncultured Pseudodesulfovibrio sp.]
MLIYMYFLNGKSLIASGHKAVITLTILLAMFSITGPSGSAASARDNDWYREHGVTVINPTNSAPLSFQGVNGDPKGYLIDIWKKWSDKTGIPVTFQFEEWAKTIPLVADGEYDIHGGLFINDERAKSLDFSRSFHELESALLVKAEYDADLSTIYDTYIVGVLKGGYTEYFLRKNKINITVKKFSTNEDIAKALANDTIQAAAGDHPVLGFEVGKKGGGHGLIVKQILFTKNIHGAVTKGNRVLLNLMNQGFSDISMAEYKNIASHWFVFHAKKTEWVRYGLIAVTILFIAVITSILLGRSKAGLDFEE